MQTQYNSMAQLFKSGNNIFKSGNVVFRGISYKQTLTLVTSIPTASAIRGFCIDASKRKGYTSHQGSVVNVIDLVSNTVLSTISSTTGQFSTSIGCDIDTLNNRLFVVNYSGQTVSVINTTNNSFITKFSTGTGDGVVYDKVYNRIITYSGTTIRVFSGVDYSLIQTITTPYAVADQSSIWYEGNKIFFCSASTSKILAYTLSNFLITPSVFSVSATPRGLSANHNNGKLYIANTNATISVLSLYDLSVSFPSISAGGGSLCPIAIDNLSEILYAPGVGNASLNLYSPIYT